MKKRFVLKNRVSAMKKQGWKLATKKQQQNVSFLKYLVKGFMTLMVK